MAHGGKRPGAGRRHGSKNKSTIALQQALAEAHAALGEGFVPLEYWLAVMRNEKVPVSVRLHAAKIAAPYIHRRQPVAKAFEPTAWVAAPVVLVMSPPPDVPDDVETPPEIKISGGKSR